MDEPDAATIISAFDADTEPAIWWAAPVETHSAIARALADRRVTKEEAAAAAERLRRLRREIDEVAPTDDIRNRAMRLLMLHRLRAADALQLAAALVWSEEQPSGDTFVCLDKRLREAARREGFVLLPAD